MFGDTTIDIKAIINECLLHDYDYESIINISNIKVYQRCELRRKYVTNDINAFAGMCFLIICLVKYTINCAFNNKYHRA